jgi:muconolactone delta-isomerase
MGGKTMQFLVITRQFGPPPLEMVTPLLEATQGWLAQHRASGKIKSAWAFAGTTNGGGVLDVDSHEELDDIVAAFPFAPFSTIDVITLSDLDRSLETAKAVSTRARDAVGATR